MKSILSKRKAMTLVELLVALMVTSIVLAAAATLVFAAGAANKSCRDSDHRQAQLRFAAVKLSDLVGHCRLILNVDSTGFYCWRADDDEDCDIDIAEVVKVEYIATNQMLRLVTFSAPSTSVTIPLDIDSFESGDSGQKLKQYCNPAYMTLISNCTGAQFLTDASVPNTKFVSIIFNVNIEGAAEQFQMNSFLRCWAGYQLDENGDLNSLDDDVEIE
jgi:prepilin-type N-terminal cleavage/methylation domain-containing protein